MSRIDEIREWAEKPTIEELEKLLDSPCKVLINPDGSLSTEQCRCALLDAANLRIKELEGRLREAYERCATIALEQRCERNTPWDRACVAIAAAIRDRINWLSRAGGKE